MNTTTKTTKATKATKAARAEKKVTTAAMAAAFRKQAKARSSLLPVMVQGPVGWDLTDAARVSLAMAARVRPVMGSLEAHTDYGPSDLAALEQCALAAGHAGGLLKKARGNRVARRASKAELALVEEGASLRARLAKQANDTVYWEALGDEAPEISLGMTAGSIADDLAALVGFYQGHEEVLKGELPFAWSEVERADEVYVELKFNRKPRAEKVSAAEAAVADEVARAATLLMKAHEKTVLAVAYARREEGDADALAPSLVTALNREAVRKEKLARARRAAAKAAEATADGDAASDPNA